MPEAGTAVADAAAASSDAVVVRLGHSRFAAELSAVAEVGRVPSLTRVPGVPRWLAGVANWRGRLLPVLDLRPLLGADATPLGPQARLLVLTADGINAGVVVDSVEGTGTLGDMQELPAALSGTATHLLAGQVPLADGPVAVLDVVAVLRLREDLPRARRGA
jgi:twitching motility protein PilI